VNLLQALADEHLFAPLFAGASWHPWKTFLRALFALPLTGAELDLYQRHTERQAPPQQPFNEAALVIGRRGGKSRVLALVAVYLATFRDYTSHLAAGEVATVAIIAADRRQARVIFRFITGLLDAVPMLRGMVDDQTAETINLSTSAGLSGSSLSASTAWMMLSASCNASSKAPCALQARTINRAFALS
jgi:hypothetical protein